MGKIMIGDNFVHTDDIMSISERTVTLNVKKKKPNPKPKPKGFLGKAFYSSTVTVMESHKYHVLVLKVAAGTQTVLPDRDDDCDFTIGRGSYGTHQLHRFYVICDDANLIKDAKELQEEYGKIGSSTLNYQLPSDKEERKSYIDSVLSELGWGSAPRFFDTCVMVDKSIKTKQNFIDKYM